MLLKVRNVQRSLRNMDSEGLLSALAVRWEDADADQQLAPIEHLLMTRMGIEKTLRRGSS